MATIVKDIFKGALQDIGELSAGQELAPEDILLMLPIYTDMVLSWNNQRLQIFETRKDEVTWPANTSKRKNTDFGIPRPHSIKNATATVAPGFSAPLEVCGSERWGTVKEKLQTGLMPEKLYCDFAWPDCTFEINPVPQIGATICIYSWFQFTAPKDESEEIDLPYGYTHAMRKELALLICAPYQKAQTQELVTAAQLAKQSLMTHNKPAVPGAAEEQELRADTARQTGGMSVPGAEPPAE